MKLTFNSGIMNPAFGFGNVSFSVFMTLKKLGYDVEYNDLSREFQVAFTAPGMFHDLFSIRSKYRVGYFAWESSLPKSDAWKHELNFCDEIWVPNKCNAEWARQWGYEGKITIFPHGINPDYSLTKTKRHTNRLDIVNLGYPGVRKASKEFFEWFSDSEFANSKDVSLTFKVYEDVAERANKLFTGVKNVNVTAGNFTMPENINFLKRFNLHVYPSYGEGFGLMPLETMANGMPTIVPRDGWCDYSYIQEQLTVPSRLGKPESEIIKSYHPGEMFVYDWDDIEDKIKYTLNNLEEVTQYAYDRSIIAEQDYNWFTLVEKQFGQYKDIID